jgi:hypothetical protein
LADDLEGHEFFTSCYKLYFGFVYLGLFCFG